MYRDYRATGEGVGAGRGLFKRLRKLGAFDEGSGLRKSNPFLEEGQQNWNENPLSRFTGAARQKPTIGNVTSAISGILSNNKAAEEDALARLRATYEGNAGVLDASRTAVMSALENPAVSPEQLAQWQAAARDRITRENQQSGAALSSRLAGQGYRQDDLNASQRALTNDALYRTGQSDIEQSMMAAEKNRQGLLDAIDRAGAFQGNVSENIQQLLGIEEFRRSLSADEVAFLEAMAGLYQARK